LVLFFNLIIVSLQIVNYYFNTNGLDRYVEEQKHLLRTSAINALSISKEYIQTTTKDYTNYDEMVQYISKPDSSFVKYNINQLVGYDAIDYLWIFNQTASKIYEASKTGALALTEPLSLKSLNEMLYIRAETSKRYLETYIRTDSNVFFISSATIHPANDNNRLISPSGVLALGKHLGSEYLKKLSLLTNALVHLHLDSTTHEVIDNLLISTNISLYDSDGKYVATLCFSRDDTYVNMSKNMIFRFTLLVILIIFFSLGLLIIVFRNSIILPFENILNSLDKGIPNPIYKYLNRNDEIGKLSKLIDRFFIQNNELELKFSEIKNLNEEIQSFNEELKMQNEEIQVLSQNVLDQKEIVERAEIRLRNIINNQGEGLVITNLEGRIVFANPVSYIILEVDEDEFLGSLGDHYFEPEEWHKIKNIMHDSSLSKRNFEVKYITPEQKVKYLFFTGAPDITRDNNTLGNIFNFTDITDLKNEQDNIKKLNQTLNKYFTAIEQSPASIIFSDINGNIEYVNPYFTYVTGYQAQEVLGKNPRILKSSETSQELFVEMWQNLLTGKSWQGEFINKKKNGDTFIEKTIVLPLLNDDSHITGYMALKEDVTEMRKAEKQLRESKRIIEQSNERLLDSIHYASGIQNALLPSAEMQYMLLPHSFVFFEPKDVVSGDFYFIKQIRQYTIIAAADCTGHGVPGAMMSMLSISLLNEVVTSPEYGSPAKILDELRFRVKQALNQSGDKREQRDGMDIALCIIDIETYELQYAGAYNPFWLFRPLSENQFSTQHAFELIEFKANNQPIGIHFNERPFTDHKLKLKNNDVFYLFSDGFASQFGGPKGQKLKKINMRKMLSEIYYESMAVQYQLVEEFFSRWKGTSEQTDDVMLLGIKVKC